MSFSLAPPGERPRRCSSVASLLRRFAPPGACGRAVALAASGEAVGLRAKLAVKTRLGICQRKRRFATREEAEAAALRADVGLRAYKCALCRQYHLTSRTKGLRVPRAAGDGAGVRKE